MLTLFLAQALSNSKTAVLTSSETVSKPFDAGLSVANCCKKFADAKPDKNIVASASAAATNSKIIKRIASPIR
ncbi:hypothetical protein [Massilia rubra]|uniref:Uncharacterized protein n=1 Tax=Massilia rubra TaxID=2607910 RepID=A0ABX0LPN6_9BURK|nr:hypothetical protein [Massilia rubra]NHZ34638.1 hypothetical protein [Massilia rubra]